MTHAVASEAARHSSSSSCVARVSLSSRAPSESRKRTRTAIAHTQQKQSVAEVAQ